MRASARRKIWAGTVSIAANAKTGVHHHGELESVIYVVKGQARMRWGERLEYVAEAWPGDFIYVPPFVPHQEINADPEPDARMRAGALRQRGRRGQHHRRRAGREARGGLLGRSYPPRALTHLVGRLFRSHPCEGVSGTAVTAPRRDQLRHCERSKAIHRVATPALRIINRFAHDRLACFASLAMTTCWRSEASLLEFGRQPRPRAHCL